MSLKKVQADKQVWSCTVQEPAQNGHLVIGHKKAAGKEDNSNDLGKSKAVQSSLFPVSTVYKGYDLYQHWKKFHKM